MSLYEALGVPSGDETTPREVLAAAYRRALLSAHPDKASPRPDANSGENDDGEDRLAPLLAAWRVLSDEAARRRYDAARAAARLGDEARRAAAASLALRRDDFDFCEASASYVLRCRCGASFRFGEPPPPAPPPAPRTLLVACEGCSLVASVHLDDDDAAA